MTATTKYERNQILNNSIQLSKYLIKQVLYTKCCINIFELYKSIKHSFLSEAQSIIQRARHISMAHRPASCTRTTGNTC